MSNDKGWVLQTRRSEKSKWKTDWYYAGKRRGDVTRSLSWRLVDLYDRGLARIVRCAAEEP